MLNWNLHTATLASRAQSITKALGIVGNSIQGLSLLPWCKIFMAIIIPILTYGLQVWFTDIRQKSLIEWLQITQNEGCQRLAGVFKTTPIYETQKLISIPLIHFCLHHLLCSASLWLSQLPQNCHIRNLCLTCQVTLPPPYFIDLPGLPQIAKTPTTSTQWQKVTKICAQAQCFWGDMQVEGGRAGLCEWKDAWRGLQQQ